VLGIYRGGLDGHYYEELPGINSGRSQERERLPGRLQEDDDRWAPPVIG
jgi:hypothetical protein